MSGGFAAARMCCLIIAVLGFSTSHLVGAQSDAEVESLVYEFEAAQAACDTATLRRFVDIRVTGYRRTQALLWIDGLTPKEIRERDDACRAQRRGPHIRIARIDRDADVSIFIRESERGVVIAYDRFDDPPPPEIRPIGLCVVAIVRAGVEWKFAGGSCSGGGVPVHPPSR